MATKSFKIRTDGVGAGGTGLTGRDQPMAVQVDTASGTIGTSGAIEVLIDDTAWRNKSQIDAALENIQQRILEYASFALTGTG